MEKMTYEKAIARLEEIVAKLESNEIPLEDSIALFQEGIELSKYCDEKLKNIQAKVAQIYEDGQLKEFQSEE
ncbi:exodeoxyribonuclease VII small subunit [Candidatus Stoquefichus sp. SB1]|jgi:exodeoxyribonuclease VII small subunit|uniref:exodeoxyribonuclease VII small subunit n=1 Tax=Candidatus Stoquefichus sp. SB1 TaxID=1658109 RepID=UPI00067EC09D|nr:exodeoxyribonuclease VII small subunit [Candidatus Stoquefichus sp. SB1]